MKLKILAIADDGFGLNIPKLIAENKDIDFILTLGDLTSFDLEGINTCGVPAYGVYGNHCARGYFNFLDIKNLHLLKREYKGVTLGGFEGCVKYKPVGDFLYTQEESRELLRDFPYVDILALHSPPFGINNNSDDPHIGLMGSREYIDRVKPKHLFHGHTYKDSKFITEYNGIKIHYIYKWEIVEIDV